MGLNSKNRVGWHPFNLDQRKIIQQGIKEGLSATDLGRMFGKSSNSVGDEIKRNGGKENYNAEEAQKNYEKKQQWRLGRYREPYTKEQIEKIHEGINRGDSIRGICEDIKTSRYTFQKFLQRYKIDMDTKSYVGAYSRIRSLEEKIDNMSMQIDIIIDLVKNVSSSNTQAQ